MKFEKKNTKELMSRDKKRCLTSNGQLKHC